MNVIEILKRVERINDIDKEAQTIYTTITMLRHLAGTVNAETTNRCIAIANNLSPKINDLYSEFKTLKKEIEDLTKE